MSTLQKISDIETTLEDLKSKMKLIETLVSPELAQEVAKLKADLATLNANLSTVSQALSNVVAGINEKIKNFNEMDNLIITRIVGIEQSYAALARTTAGVVSELLDNGSINQKSVEARVRKSGEVENQERVATMEKLGAIKESSEAVADSLLIVSQTFKPKEGEPNIISEYSLVELSSPDIDTETRDSYLGKGAGSAVELNLESGILTTTVLKVYDYVQIASSGESQQATANQ